MRFHSVACGMPSRTLQANAIGYAKFYSRSHQAVIRVYDAPGNVIETHEHKGDLEKGDALRSARVLLIPC